MTTDILTQRVHNLPGEIRNHIADLVFTADIYRLPIDQNYRPPPRLRVNRSSRHHYLQQYYDRTIFKCKLPTMLFKYLSSLDPVSRAHMRSVRLIITTHGGAVEQATRQRFERERNLTDILGDPVLARQSGIEHRVRLILGLSDMPLKDGVIALEYRPSNLSQNTPCEIELRKWIDMRTWIDLLAARLGGDSASEELWPLSIGDI